MVSKKKSVTSRGKFREVKEEVTRLKRQWRDRGGQPIVSSATRLQPPTYDGQTSWCTYKRQFEAAALANNWNNEEKAMALVLALRGQALELLQTIPVAEQHDFCSLEAALDLRYGDQHLAQVYQAQLKTRTQKAGESLQEFEAAVERLAHLAYPDAPREFQQQLAVGAFIDGIRDEEIRRVLRLSRHRRSNEALVHALEVEAAYKDTPRSKVRAVTVEEPHSEKTNLDVVLADVHKMFTELMTKLNTQPRQEKQQNGGRPSGGIRCYKCGKQGHMERDCRQRSPKREYVASIGELRGILTDIHKVISQLLTKLDSPRRQDKQQSDEKHSGGIRCYECGKQGHTKRHCQQKSTERITAKNIEKLQDAITVNRVTVDIPDDWNKEILRKEQLDDKDIGPILRAKEKGTRPEWKDVSDKSIELKALWAQWDSLRIIDGLLKRAWESPDGKEVTMRLVIPRCRVSKVLQEVHNGVSGGHFGINKTLKKVRERFYWISSRQDVEAWCRKCKACAATKGPQTRSNYADEVSERLRNVHELVRNQTTISSYRMKARYDRKASSGGFKVGDLVWLYNPQRKKGRSPKLQQPWEGPYTVITRINDVVYRIQKSKKSKMKVVHLDRLAKYVGDIELPDRDVQA